VVHGISSQQNRQTERDGNEFPVTAGIRGTIEFDPPPGATISALGIRVPHSLTFTTLPALAK
jgi:hypothetical protein